MASTIPTFATDEEEAAYWWGHPHVRKARRLCKVQPLVPQVGTKSSHHSVDLFELVDALHLFHNGEGDLIVHALCRLEPPFSFFEVVKLDESLGEHRERVRELTGRLFSGDLGWPPYVPHPRAFRIDPRWAAR